MIKTKLIVLLILLASGQAYGASRSNTAFPVITPATDDYFILTDTNNSGLFGKVTFANIRTALAFQDSDADLTDLADGSLTGTKVGFADTDNLFTATNIQAAVEELNDSINAGAPNGTGAKVHWSQLLGVPAGFADGTDSEGVGGGYTNLTSFIGQTPWKLFYSNTDGDVVELGFGNDGEYLKSNGAALAPSWATPSGAAHDAVTLDTELSAVLSLSTQQITLDSQTANYFWAAPNGSAGDPVFRAIVAADIPTLNQNTTGTAGGLSGTPNITVGTVSAGATGFSVDADGDVTAKSYLSSAVDGSRRSELPNNTSITPLGGGVEEIYNEAGAIKAVENDTEYDIMLSRDIGAAIQAYDADLDDLADGSLTGSKVSAASDSAAGVSELATTAETNTGTSTSLTVTPDGLSGSVYGQKEIGWYVIASDTVTAVADGKQAAVVPASMNGMNLVDMTCSVHDLNSAASGDTTVVLRRVRGATAADMTSTGVTIAYTDYTASDETVDTSNDDVATGDKIYVDVNAVTSAAQKGLSCTAIFQTP